MKKLLREINLIPFIIANVVFLCMAKLAFTQETNAQTGGVPKGYMIIEGDILVPIDFYKNRLQATWRQNRFWPNGIVPFRFNANVTAAQQNAILDAMAEWERVANIDFIERTTQNDWVEILDADNNSSAVGRQGGRQIINIFNWNNRWTMCHELAHCLGYWHEQSRPDRDNYVRLNFENIEDEEENNFDKHEDAGQYGHYDFDSVMHYGPFDFCLNPCPGLTITVLSPNETWQYRIGQRTHLSRLDMLTMSFLYAQPHWRFVDGSSPGGIVNGSFFRPLPGFSPSIASSAFIPAGAVVWIQPGHYASVDVYTKAMTLQAPLSSVVLGR